MFTLLVCACVCMCDCLYVSESYSTHNFALFDEISKLFGNDNHYDKAMCRGQKTCR